MEVQMKYAKSSFSLQVLILGCLLVLVATGVGAAEDPPAGKEKRVVATVGDDGVQRVEVTGGAYYYDPNYIVVKVNSWSRRMAASPLMISWSRPRKPALISIWS